MSYSPGDWVELTRTVDGVPAGKRGKVTSTGFVGGLDIELSSGARLINVDASDVRSAPPSTGDGCGLALVALAAGTASVVGVLVRAWAGARWGL